MKYSKISSTSSAGFTLVELMIAILLLVVGVLAALSMVSTSVKSNSLANVLSVKTALAHQVMEDRLSLQRNDPILNSSTTDPVPYDLNGAASGNDLMVPGAGTFRASYMTTVNDPVSNVTKVVVFIDTVPVNPDKRLSFTSHIRVEGF